MSRAPKRYYRVFKIRKGKKTRIIQAPRIALKVIQSWFGTHLSRAITLQDCVFGFVPGKDGVREAAAVHCGADWVYSIDLRDFFHSISDERVISAVQAVGYSGPTSHFIVRLLTFEGRLPQGSPASPVLSNLAFAATDRMLNELATAKGIRYTRYADDLVFSGSGQPPALLRELIRAIVSENNWTVADEKEHLAIRPARLKVHGLLVSGTMPRLTKGYRNRLRAFQHLLANNKIAEKDLSKIRGHLSYAKHIEDSHE